MEKGEGESCQREEKNGKYWEERDFTKIVLGRKSNKYYMEERDFTKVGDGG